MEINGRCSQKSLHSRLRRNDMPGLGTTNQSCHRCQVEIHSKNTYTPPRKPMVFRNITIADFRIFSRNSYRVAEYARQTMAVSGIACVNNDKSISAPPSPFSKPLDQSTQTTKLPPPLNSYLSGTADERVRPSPQIRPRQAETPPSRSGRGFPPAAPPSDSSSCFSSP